MRVKPTILRTYQSLHTWTGICAGLFLFIGFYAGSLTMFKHQLQQWIAPTPVLHQTTIPKDLTRWQQLLDQTLSAHPTELAAGFELDLTRVEPAITWYRQGSARELAMDNRLVTAQLDTQGQLQLTEQTENQFADLIDYLHRSAGIAGEIGHDQAGVYVLGIAAVMYFLALVSGVVILLPTLVKTLFALRTNKGTSRFWLDSHNLVGISSLPFHFIIAWTVIGFAFHDLIYDGLAVFYGDQPVFQRPAPSRQTFQLDSLPPLAAQVAAAKAYSPAHEPQKLSFMRLTSPAPMLTVEMHNPNGMVRGPAADYLFLQPFTLQVQPFSFSTAEGASYGKFVLGLFSLHFGTYAGDFGRWGYFLLGLLGAFLFYSGNLLWLDKRMKKAAAADRYCRYLAALTVGVCLGSMFAVALTMLVGKLAAPWLPNVNYAYLWCYYFSFIVFVGYSCWLGAARSAYHGLLALSVTCALLPVATLYLQWSRPLQYQLNLTMAVDLMALLLAGLFAYAAAKTNRRLQQAIPGSVWSVPPQHHSTTTAVHS